MVSPLSVVHSKLDGRRNGSALRVDGGPEVLGVVLRGQPGDGDPGVEVGIAEVERAVRIGPPHRLRHQVHVRRRAEAVPGEVVALKDVQHLDERRASRTRRGHRKDLVAAVFAPDGLAHHGAVVLQVLEGDEPAVRGHLGGQELRGLALVKPRRAVLQDPVEAVGQVGLAEDLAGLVRRPLLRELRHRGRIGRHPLEHPRERSGESVRDPEAVAGQLHRRPHEALPGHRALLFPGEAEARHRARNPHRLVAQVVDLEAVLPVLVEPHLGVCRSGGLLAEVVGERLAARRPPDQEPAAADVAGSGMGHRHREGGRHRGVHRVPAVAQNPGAHLGSDRALRDHHALTRADRGAFGPGEAGGQRQAERQRRKERRRNPRAPGVPKPQIHSIPPGPVNPGEPNIVAVGNALRSGPSRPPLPSLPHETPDLSVGGARPAARRSRPAVRTGRGPRGGVHALERDALPGGRPPRDDHRVGGLGGPRRLRQRTPRDHRDEPLLRAHDVQGHPHRRHDDAERDQAIIEEQEAVQDQIRAIYRDRREAARLGEIDDPFGQEDLPEELVTLREQFNALVRSSGRSWSRTSSTASTRRRAPPDERLHLPRPDGLLHHRAPEPAGALVLDGVRAAPAPRLPRVLRRARRGSRGAAAPHRVHPHR